jgi:hypothetical protein
MPGPALIRYRSSDAAVTVCESASKWDPCRFGLIADYVRPAFAARDDDGTRVLHLGGRREVTKGWLAPTLLLDALLDPLLVRPFWPQVQVTADPLRRPWTTKHRLASLCGSGPLWLAP